MSNATKQRTVGDFGNEQDSADYFDQWVKYHAKEYFTVHSEVSGRYLSNPPGVESSATGNEKRPRIDRIVVPTPSLVAAGWHHGPFGVELKCSSKKLGKPFSQALDYSEACFEIKPGFHILLEWIFLFPCEKFTDAIESIGAHKRIGWASMKSKRWPVVFGSGGMNAIKLEVVDYKGDMPQVKVEAKDIPSGRKRGSR